MFASEEHPCFFGIFLDLTETKTNKAKKIRDFSNKRREPDKGKMKKIWKVPEKNKAEDFGLFRDFSDSPRDFFSDFWGPGV